jgi:predicted amidohydrolase YtcJ
VSTILLIGGPIYSLDDPFADAMLIQDGRVAWIGQSEAADRHPAEHVVPLNGALVAPAFVDAHVHATSAGLALIGLDLSAARSGTEALAMIETESRRLRGAPLIGHGWDESGWPEGRAPSRQEIDRATHGSVVYLSRRDVHSALVSSALLATLPGIEGAAGYRDDGVLTADAHAMARTTALSTIAARRRGEAQRAFLRHCASVGIAAIHECAGPIVSSEDDLLDLRREAAAEGIDLTTYWGQIGAEGIATAQRLGARPGGDLFVDGSLGSHTALLAQPYADAATHGNRYLDEEEITGHLRLATDAGLQAGFHAIGDEAIASIVRAAKAVAASDPSRFRSLGHRIEHVEMASDDTIATMRELAMVASVQPTFDWLWGGGAGMYADRLGTERARTLNRFASWQRAGLSLAFGSDAPVTPAQPWEWIRAALFHSVEEERLTARSAFAAATRGGWRAAGAHGAGVLAVGAPAALAIWDAPPLIVQTPATRVAAWSTDQRAGTPALPEISLSGALPTCLATINGSRVLHSRFAELPSE